MSLNKGNFFSFIMYKESYLKIFEFFILNVHLIAPIFSPFLFIELCGKTPILPCPNHTQCFAACVMCVVIALDCLLTVAVLLPK